MSDAEPAHTHRTDAPPTSAPGLASDGALSAASASGAAVPVHEGTHSSNPSPPTPTRPTHARTGGASLGKNVILFVAIMGTLATGYAYLGREIPAAAPPAVRWAAGQTVDIDITLVPTDATNLACASKAEVAGRHCAFESPDVPWATSSTNGDDPLKPYTSTNRIQFLASSLWSQPALSPEKLPKGRFTVKCKLAVEGKIRSPHIRWDASGPWNPQSNDWYAGRVASCTLAP